ncbi:hypothetical protein GCM10009854_00700 [Saccharopolyspora halophila]|uniref:Uncharacterized protein n=2 Tax=Saccharopolyspora halophila TaxID=405551 RepID=A0ABN3FH34_9PSEU
MIDMGRKTLLGITIVWAVLIGALAAGFYVMTTNSGTELGKSSDVAAASSGPKYEWSGEQMLISTEPSNKTAVCRIVPENGVPKDITTFRSETANRVNAIEPWFSGKAEMTCNMAVKVRTGGDVTMYELATKDRLVQILVVVVAVLPFLLVAIFGFAVRGRKASKTEA